MNYNYSYNYNDFYGDAFNGMQSFGPFLLGLFLIFLVIGILAGVFYALCMWKLFTKAGQPGWKSLIPFYNTYIMILISGNPGWWLLLFFIPYVNIVMSILMIEAFVRAFGRNGIGSILMMLFLGIFYMPYLAFSKDVRYVGAQQAYRQQYGFGNGSQYPPGYGPQHGQQHGEQPGYPYAPQSGAQPGYPYAPQSGAQPGYPYGQQGGHQYMPVVPQQIAPGDGQFPQQMTPGDAQFTRQSGPSYGPRNVSPYGMQYEPQPPFAVQNGSPVPDEPDASKTDKNDA